MFKNLRKKKKGFTLIELIIVIAILAILAAVALPRLSGFTTSAKEKADIANAKTIANAVTLLMAEDKITKDKTYKLEGKATDGDLYTIESYLQTVPKTSDDKVFEVMLDADGKIVVRNATTTTTEYFPKATTKGTGLTITP